MFINTPFNYTGSKFKVLEQILPLFDYSKTSFIDVFAGGGSVYTNIVDKYNKIIVNDIIEDLISIHEGLIENNDIISKTTDYCVDRDDQNGFNELRKNYNNDREPAKLWALMLCSTNNMMRFNRNFEYNQTFGKRTINDSTFKKIETFTNHIRKFKDKIQFKHTHFKSIPIEKNTFYYLDPPYGYILDNEGVIKNKQISEAGYNNYYNKDDDIDLYNYVHNINLIGSTFMLSGVLEHDGNVSWLLRKLIDDGFNYKIIDLNYNKVSRKMVDKKTIEIVVYNYGN